MLSNKLSNRQTFNRDEIENNNTLISNKISLVKSQTIMLSL